MPPPVFLVPFALVASLLAVIPVAKGAETCSGTIRTSELHPLPRGATIASSRALEDSANPDLSSRFMNGIGRSGMATGDSGSVILTLTAEVVAPSGERVVQSGRRSGFSNFDWMGRLQSTPAHAPSLKGASLSMSVQVTDKRSSRIAWLAVVRCRVTTDDPGALAEELGTLIGSSLGKSSYTRPL